MDHLRLELGQLWKPGYYKNIFDSSKHRFHDFPNTIGWVLSDETLEFKPDPAKTAKIKFDQFLQSWLFFGLLHTVLQKPSKELSRAGALVSDSEEFINTTNLNNYLEGWSRDVAEQDTHSRSLRMIRAQVALERACRVVREYCSDDGKMKKPEGHPCYVDPVLGLSLMVLGETLTNAKSKIAEKSGLSITGWHGDPMEGWGTPTCVLEKMMDDGWCRKLVEVLKLQLRSHATSILAAFASHEQNNAKTAYLIEGHEECTKDRCKLKFVESGGKYVTQHQLSCPRHPKHRNHSNDESVCKFIPLEIKDVVKHLEKHHIPLLEYNKEEGKVTVQKYEPYTPYATLSHVWSDGYGNPDANLLWRCQLDFFDDLFREAQQEERKLFWIDTLAIPIQEEYKKYRRIAIRQIHQVYTNARYTIVIDKGLGGMSRADSYEATAMRILASNWMRRLWTLQEAYLSRRLYFAFAPGAKGRLKNLEDLEEMYPKANDILTSNIPSAARNYFHNLLGNDRRARINELAAGEGIDVMASVWRAARWRTTNHQEHETLALATLLNLDYKNTKFQDAGLLQKQVKVTEDQLEGMMIDLWKLLDKTCPGSIPPGIIFLPGEKIKEPAFGWAPKTWMLNQEVDFPDPLANMVGAGKLVPEGLLVQYPGFLLHANTPASILKANSDSFHFPSDSTLSEWYGVDLTDLRKNPPKGNEGDTKQLAIILCRPKPREIPEIALLVEIEEQILQRSFADKHHRSTILHVLYDRRVKIWRETNTKQLSKWRGYIMDSLDHDHRMVSARSKDEDRMICGEALDNDQRWIVGGRPILVEDHLDEDARNFTANMPVTGAPIVVEAGRDSPELVMIPEPTRATGPFLFNSRGDPEGLGFPSLMVQPPADFPAALPRGDRSQPREFPTTPQNSSPITESATVNKAASEHSDRSFAVHTPERLATPPEADGASTSSPSLKKPPPVPPRPSTMVQLGNGKSALTNGKAT